MRNFIFTAIAVLAFSGCASLMNEISGKDPQKWYKFLENNETLQEISFYKRVASGSNIGSVQGSAIIKIPVGKSFTTQDLGDAYLGSVGKNVILIDLDANKNVDMSSQDEIKKLQSSKNIKFYEFSNAMIESVVYSSDKKSVCRTFIDSDEAVKARSVTNYYTQNQGEFFATVINADIVGNKGYEIKNLDFKFFVDSKNLPWVKEFARSDEFKKDAIEQDILKQGRFLLNVVCYSMFVK
ncbi:MAG: hypothetical protein LUC34_00755 [Campylobacter sp.]|nr:hypothetical protein [Campylobacter sp.]